MAITDTAIEPFVTPVDTAALADLTERLRRTRWPDREPVDDWSQGTPRHLLQELCGYWADTYDWVARAARLDRHAQYTTVIDDLTVHFVHVRSLEPNAVPLLLTHGWPGSFVEFHDAIDLLTDPVAHGGDSRDAFHVVCPSLPGYGWSDAPRAAGVGVVRIAEMWAELMARLGYSRYGAQGGDWGAMVTTGLGTVDAEHLIGVHLNMPLAFPTDAPSNEHEKNIVQDMAAFMADGSGYQKVQATRPQTIGYSLVDSPAGLAGWIFEKLWSWSDHDGDIGEVLSFDQILDNVMLYWLPGRGASAARLYWESGREPSNLGKLNVPVGCSIFPKEMLRTSRRWAEHHFSDLRYFNEVDRGGHFAAFEQPALFVDEVRTFFRLLRDDPKEARPCTT